MKIEATGSMSFTINIKIESRADIDSLEAVSNLLQNCDQDHWTTFENQEAGKELGKAIKEGILYGLK